LEKENDRGGNKIENVSSVRKSFVIKGRTNDHSNRRRQVYQKKGKGGWEEEVHSIGYLLGKSIAGGGKNGKVGSANSMKKRVGRLARTGKKNIAGVGSVEATRGAEVPKRLNGPELQGGSDMIQLTGRSVWKRLGVDEREPLLIRVWEKGLLDIDHGRRGRGGKS